MEYTGQNLRSGRSSWVWNPLLLLTYPFSRIVGITTLAIFISELDIIGRRLGKLGIMDLVTFSLDQINDINLDHNTSDNSVWTCLCSYVSIQFYGLAVIKNKFTDSSSKVSYLYESCVLGNLSTDLAKDE